MVYHKYNIQSVNATSYANIEGFKFTSTRTMLFEVD